MKSIDIDYVENELKKLDVWVSERLPAIREQLKHGFVVVPGIQLLAEGIGPGYWNLFAAVHPAIYQQVLDRITGVEGVYVNELPPELQAAMDAELSLCDEEVL